MLVPLLLGFAAFAAAQDMPPQGGGRAMMRADANGDGIVTREEHVAQATERFDRMDANRDGKLDQTELQRVGQRMRAMRGEMPPPPKQ